jgi:large conductance mechanosensitive channel
MGILKDFKEFAMKGNIIDLATAVIIGNEFGKIIQSAVNDILMPPIGILLGSVDFKDLKVVIQPKGNREVLEGGKLIMKEVAEVTLNYGMFIQNIINFIIVAFCIFIVIKIYTNALKKKEEAPAPAAPAEPTKEEVLLTEIRDILKSK